MTLNSPIHPFQHEISIHYKCNPFLKSSVSEKGDTYCEGIIPFREDNKFKVCLTGKKLNVNNSDRVDEFLFQVSKKVFPFMSLYGKVLFVSLSCCTSSFFHKCLYGGTFDFISINAIQ